MNYLKLSSLIFLFSFSLTIGAQQAVLFADINPGSVGSWPAFDNGKIVFQNKLFFTADDGTHGNELWVTDGVSQSTPQLFLDINPGLANSECQNFYELNGLLIFTASDGVHGNELWRSDGTPQGTFMIKDIYPGPEDGVTNNLSGKLQHWYYIWNNVLYFMGQEGGSNYEMWRTDGTEEGTYLIKNIGPDFSSFNTGSFPQEYTPYNGELYFSCWEGLWKTDGTEAGTVEVKGDDPSVTFSFEPFNMFSCNGHLLFFEDGSIWQSDGTEAGTIRLKDFTSSGTLNTAERAVVKVNEVLYFPGNDGTTGGELWRSDGTLDGTYVVRDASNASENYPPQDFAVVDDVMYYKFSDGTHGIEMWRSDGTEAGTYLVKDIAVGSSSSFYLPSQIRGHNGKVYFKAGTAFNQELWTSDGTEEGTYQIADIYPGGESRPFDFGSYNDTLVFFANHPDAGFEMFYLDEFFTSTKNPALEKLAVKTFPNPVEKNSKLTVSFNTTDQAFKSLQITLLDSSMKAMTRYQFEENEWNGGGLQIPAPDVSGFYFVKLTFDHQESLLQKILVE